MKSPIRLLALLVRATAFRSRCPLLAVGIFGVMALFDPTGVGNSTQAPMTHRDSTERLFGAIPWTGLSTPTTGPVAAGLPSITNSVGTHRRIKIKQVSLMSEQRFTLTSPSFGPDQMIPSALTCDGENTSPALNWGHPPEGTRSFALILDDPDAPRGTFTHWVLFDIPADARGLPAKVRDIGVGGRNDFRNDHYGGPCPPPNRGKHHYFFKLFALNVPSLNLPLGASRKAVENAMQGHILGQVHLVGLYQRKTK